MKNLIERNYKSIVKRGLISPNTKHTDFINKIEEEKNEIILAYLNNDKINLSEEIADVILVCLNFAKHYNIDIEKVLNQKIKINEKRTD